MHWNREIICKIKKKKTNTLRDTHELRCRYVPAPTHTSDSKRSTWMLGADCQWDPTARAGGSPTRGPITTPDSSGRLPSVDSPPAAPRNVPRDQSWQSYVCSDQTNEWIRCCTNINDLTYRPLYISVCVPVIRICVWWLYTVAVWNAFQPIAPTHTLYITLFSYILYMIINK